MPARRRVPVEEGLACVRAWGQHQDKQTSPDSPDSPDSPASPPLGRAVIATAVRFTLEELASCAPGHSVEVRVPPFGVTQAVAGTVHRRGTPPSVVETDAATWLALATGRLGWRQALESGALSASGQRCDLSAYLPLVRA